MPKFVCVDGALMLNLDQIVSVEYRTPAYDPTIDSPMLAVRLAATKLTENGVENVAYKWTGSRARELWRLFKTYGIIEEFDWQTPAGGESWQTMW